MPITSALRRWGGRMWRGRSCPASQWAQGQPELQKPCLKKSSQTKQTKEASGKTTDSGVTFHRHPGRWVAGCQGRHCHLLDVCSSAPCTAGQTIRPEKAAVTMGEGCAAEPPPCRWQGSSRGLHRTAALPVSRALPSPEAASNSKEEGFVLAWVRTQCLP